MREMMKSMFANFNLLARPVIDLCKTEIIKYSPKEYGSDNDGQLDIHVHKVIGKEDVKRKAMIYFHGGGAVMQDPYQYYCQSTAMALYGDMTVFSCEYRLGPEKSVPGGILDAYAAINYITSHAEQFNIDATRIGIYGASGGGFIVSGVTYELAKRDKAHLVKIVYLDTP